MVEQAPGAHRTEVGDTVVWTLSDGHLNGAPAVLRGVGEEEAVRLLHDAFRGTAPMRLSVNAFALERDGRLALVDAGGGGAMGPTLGRVPDAMRAAGLDAGRVEVVLLTHLHGDHMGGLLEPDGGLRFPNATLCLSRVEAEHFRDDAAMAAAGEARRAGFEGARRVLDAHGGRVRLLEPGEEGFPGAAMVPLPGHTPGHCGFRIGEGAESLLIWGDIAHVPELQVSHPGITVMFDSDPAQAEATRRAVLAEAARTRQRVAGMHLHFPALAHVAERNGEYALVPEPWGLT